MFSTVIESAIRSKNAYEDTGDGELISSDEDTQVWYKETEDTVYVTFRGTSSFKDILTDINLQTYRVKGNIRVHEGFYMQFKSVELDITKRLVKASGKNIVFAGHSLGGALAQIAAAYYGEVFDFAKVVCHTFGSPRVGNRYFVEWFSKWVDENVRVENKLDPVPMIPQFPRWVHTVNTCYSMDDSSMKVREQDIPWYKRFVRLFSAKLSEHDSDLYIVRASKHLNSL